MQKPINLRYKLWPNWDGPFVVDYTDKDTYQLGSANGFIVRRLVNGEGLKVYDECVKKENELDDGEMEMRKVALENMELQRLAAELKTKTNANANAKAKADVEACASMVRLGEASKENKRREEEYRPRGAMVAETSVLRAESLPDQYAAVAFIVVKERTMSQRLVVDERMDDSRVAVVREEMEPGAR
jgi:hypothetical protein